MLGLACGRLGAWSWGFPVHQVGLARENPCPPLGKGLACCAPPFPPFEWGRRVRRLFGPLARRAPFGAPFGPAAGSLTPGWFLSLFLVPVLSAPTFLLLYLRFLR